MADGNAAGEGRQETGEERKCAYCLIPMPSKARLCKTCGMRQNEWRNALTYLSGVAGLAALIGSGMLFIWAQGQATYVRMFGADIEVRNASSIGMLTLFNNSTQDVVIAAAGFSMPGVRTVDVIIDETVEAGAIGRFHVGELFKEQTESAPGLATFTPDVMDRLFVPGEPLPGGWGDTDVAGKAPQEVSEILRKAAEDNILYARNLTVEAINRGGRDYSLLVKGKTDGVDLVLVPCRIEIAYQVVREFRPQEPIRPDCVGMVRRKKKMEASP